MKAGAVSGLELPSEHAHDARKQLRRRRKAVRARFVKAERDMRPALMWRSLSFLLRHVGMTAKGARDCAQTTVEWIFLVFLWGVWIILAAFFFADIVRHRQASQDLFYGHIGGAIIALTVALAGLLCVFVDLMTYRPRLFARCAGLPGEFFRELAQFSTSLNEEVGKIIAADAGTWSQVKELEQGLLHESHQFLLLDSLRFRITRRVLNRLINLVASLTLVGYSLSAISHGKLLVGAGTGTGIAEHAYFTLVTFFTIGFGDVHPRHTLLAYSYVLLIVATFTAVVYFVLTDIVASHSEFRTNIRGAAEGFVLQNSDLGASP